ncbi:MAG: hypothetical protein HY897_22420 [Deltaproteobacteria bacterium]|nr:hypothetical protein [Deltaproteobacteria bacterium]
MKGKIQSGVVRRSVAVPRGVLDEVLKAAAPELRDNFNRLVIVALQEYVARRREYEFAASMAQMAADPAIRYECKTVSDGLSHADADGLGDES